MNSAQASCERLMQSRDRLRQALNQVGRSACDAQASLLAKTTCRVVTDVASNHPMALITGAALAGALLVRTKAWRWLPASALLAGLMPLLVKVLATREKP